MIPWQIDTVDGQPTVHIEARSMSPWQVQRYLVKLGGQVLEEHRHVVGDGWEARLKRGQPVGLGSLKIGVVQLDLFGDEETLESMMKKLSLWLMRGGG